MNPQSPLTGSVPPLLAGKIIHVRCSSTGRQPTLSVCSRDALSARGEQEGFNNRSNILRTFKVGRSVCKEGLIKHTAVRKYNTACDNNRLVKKKYYSRWQQLSYRYWR